MDFKQLFTGGAAGDIGKLIKSLIAGDLDWNQIPSLARAAGFPADEVNCFTASIEAFMRDRENPVRDTRSMLNDLVCNFHLAGPEHWYYIAFRLIEEAHNSFTGPIKDRKEETTDEADSTGSIPSSDA